jgi:hypothetical protein
VCLFVKDHQGEGHTAAKARLAKLQKNGGITKVGSGLRAGSSQLLLLVAPCLVNSCWLRRAC